MVSIQAPTPKDAYAKLCDILQAGVTDGILEYETDTFTTEEDTENDRDTEELFPDMEEAELLGS